MRREKDFIGEKLLDEDALYGIHSVRARENFPDEGRFHHEWYRSMAVTKRACYLTAASFFAEAAKKYDLARMNIRVVTAEKLAALSAAAEECAAGKHFEHFIVPAVSGGAGTSINMNINEIIANRALQIMSRLPGEYDIIDPIEDANIFQSTNDVVPTALRVAAMRLLAELDESINELRKRLKNLSRDTGTPFAWHTHRCRRPCRQPSAGSSAATAMHSHATGGGYPNAWKEQRWLTWEVRQLVLPYRFLNSSLPRWSQSSGI